jgi:hypothetical protein
MAHRPQMNLAQKAGVPEQACNVTLTISVKPDDTVNIYYHMSSNGSPQRGPWNQEPEFTYIADPVKQMSHGESPGSGARRSA